MISGALTGVQRDFKLSPLLIEVVTSWVTLGALAGSLAGGELADRLGRRKALARRRGAVRGGRDDRSAGPRRCGPGMRTAGRGIRRRRRRGGGAAVRGRARAGCATRPLRVLLSARDHARHLRLVPRRCRARRSRRNWRLMLGVSAVPAVLLLVAMLPAVESPRWLVRVGRRDDARAAIIRARPWIDPDVRLQCDRRRRCATSRRNASWGEVFAPALAPAARWSASGSPCSSRSPASTRSSTTRTASSRPRASRPPLAQTQATTWAIGAVNVARHAHRDRLHRPARAPAAAARGARRAWG